MSASLLVLMNSFLYIFSLGLSYARFLPGILVTSASCPHFFRMTVTQAVWFSFSGIQLPVLNSHVKRNHSNSTRDSQHQYENQEGHPLATQPRLQRSWVQIPYGPEIFFRSYLQLLVSVVFLAARIS